MSWLSRKKDPVTPVATPASAETTPFWIEQALAFLRIYGFPIFIIFYWGFAWYFEQLSPSSALSALAAMRAGDVEVTVGQIMIKALIDLFRPTTLLHFLPIVAGWWLAKNIAVRLVQDMYDIEDPQGAEKFLTLLQSSQGGGGDVKAVVLQPGRLAALKEEHLFMRLGGPGLVKVLNGTAVITEINGRFKRVLGPGKQMLLPFEYVHSIEDLRIQQRGGKKAEQLYTKDGHPLAAELTVVFRICPDDKWCDERSRADTVVDSEPLYLGENNNEMMAAVADGEPYSFGPQAVYRAVYRNVLQITSPDVLNAGLMAHSKLERQTLTWKEIAPETAVQTLRDLVAEFEYQELFSADPAFNPKDMLQKKLQQRTADKMCEFGVAILQTRLDALNPVVHKSRRELDFGHNSQHNTERLPAFFDQSFTDLDQQLLQGQAIFVEAILGKTQLTNDWRRVIASPDGRDQLTYRLIGALEQYARDLPEVAMLHPELLNAMRAISRQSRSGGSSFRLS